MKRGLYGLVQDKNHFDYCVSVDKFNVVDYFFYRAKSV